MRMRLRNRKKFRIRVKMLIVMVIMVLLIFLFVKISSNASLYILEYAKEESYSYTIDIINNSIDDNTLKLISSDDLFKITRNNDNEIEMIDYNTYLVNIILKGIVGNIQKNFDVLENDVLFYVPFGTLFNNVFVSNMGPNIPARIKLIGSISSTFETRVTEYGINNCLIELFVSIEINERIMLPLLSDRSTFKIKIPISYKIVTGKIPIYYGGYLVKSSDVYDVYTK